AHCLVADCITELALKHLLLDGPQCWPTRGSIDLVQGFRKLSQRPWRQDVRPRQTYASGRTTSPVSRAVTRPDWYTDQDRLRFNSCTLLAECGPDPAWTLTETVLILLHNPSLSCGSCVRGVRDARVVGGGRVLLVVVHRSAATGHRSSAAARRRAG